MPAGREGTRSIYAASVKIFLNKRRTDEALPQCVSSVLSFSVDASMCFFCVEVFC